LTNSTARGEGFVALMQSQMAFFSWDLDRDLVFGDEILAEFFDLDHKELSRGLPIMPFVEKICEADRARVAESIHRAIETGSPYQETYGIWHRDGHIKTVIAMGRCFRSEDGVPSIYSGAMIDVTCAKTLVKSDPLEIHCLAALELATMRGSELVARYLTSALGVMGNAAGT
jgi:PAS domain-containing protein